MSRLRRPFLYDRFIFVTVNLVLPRTMLQDSEFARLAVHAGVSSEEQERRCGLRTDRVSLPADANTPI